MADPLSWPIRSCPVNLIDPVQHAYDGYVAYRMLDEEALAPEIAQMRDLMERDWRTLKIDQDLGLGMLLWLVHFFPGEPWAKTQTKRALATLDTMWIDPPGYFCRTPWLGETKFAFANYGVSLGLQAAGIWPECVERLNTFFESWRSGDEYDREAITWVMACPSHLPGVSVAPEA